MDCMSYCDPIPTNGNSGTCTNSSGIDCRDSCYEYSDAQAVVVYDSWMQCVATHCGAVCDPAGDPSLCDQCVQTQCQFQLNACMNDW